jgi:hypothetical protein
MADLTLPAELVEKLEEFARRENRSVEDLIASLLDEYSARLAYPQTGASDQDVPENSLQSLLDKVLRNPSVWSFGESARYITARSREILNTEYADYLLARMKRPPIPNDE